jgi:hypothetical protein
MLLGATVACMLPVGVWNICINVLLINSKQQLTI